MSAQRWRFERAEVHGGRRVAVIRNRAPRPDESEVAYVYFARGAWRRWEAREGDRHAGSTLAAVARRGLNVGGGDAD